MHKKFLVSLLLVLSLIFTVSFCYANENMQNAGENAKDALNSTGKAIENAAQGTGEMIQDGANAVKDGAQNMGNAIKDGVENTGDAIRNGADNTDNYNATRTEAEGDFMGMTNNTWSWIILGVAAIAIIALVWYYSSQVNRNKYNDHDE